MKDLGKGIGTAGIWMAVASVAFAGGEAVIALPMVALAAMFATGAVWFFGAT